VLLFKPTQNGSTTQIFILNEDAGFQTVINNVNPSIVVI